MCTLNGNLRIEAVTCVL